MFRRVVLVVMEVPVMRTSEKLLHTIRLWIMELPRLCVAGGKGSPQRHSAGVAVGVVSKNAIIPADPTCLDKRWGYTRRGQRTGIHR